MLTQTISKFIFGANLPRNYHFFSQLLVRRSANLFSFTTETQTTKDLQHYIKSDRTIKLLKLKGIQNLFPIQTKTFQSIYDGKDVIAGDKTGSGKTMAFALPVIERMRNNKQFENEKGLKFVILAPTRQLAAQITNELLSIKHGYHDFKVFSAYGGSSVNRNILALQKNPDILVGTPGRILDLINRKVLDFSKVSAVCVDEADFMFDIGFKEHINDILNQIRINTTKPCQYLCFTATLNNEVANITSKFMKNNKVTVKINNQDSKNMTPVEIKHIVTILNSYSEKIDQIYSIIEKQSKGGRVIIFTNTKLQANKISENLQSPNVVLHGDIEQQKRFERLKIFKDGDVKVLIATDVAARGLDIPNVELVINFDSPQKLQSYVHRSGRTGRAGKTGTCVTFFKNRMDLKQFTKYGKSKFGIKIEERDDDNRLNGNRSSIQNLDKSQNFDQQQQNSKYQIKIQRQNRNQYRNPDQSQDRNQYQNRNQFPNRSSTQYRNQPRNQYRNQPRNQYRNEPRNEPRNQPRNQPRSPRPKRQNMSYLQNQYILFDKANILTLQTIKTTLNKQQVEGQVKQIISSFNSNKFYILKTPDTSSKEKILGLGIGERSAKFVMKEDRRA